MIKNKHYKDQECKEREGLRECRSGMELHIFLFSLDFCIFSWKLILPFLFGYVFSSQQNKDFLLISLSEPKKWSFTLVAISVFILKIFVVFSKRKFVRFWNIFFFQHKFD